VNPLHFSSDADKVFGPATTTRHVYDVAAQHVVSGAMQGINGMFPFSALLIGLEIYVVLIGCETGIVVTYLLDF
jgi:hypothetical protein